VALFWRLLLFCVLCPTWAGLCAYRVGHCAAFVCRLVCVRTRGADREKGRVHHLLPLALALGRCVRTIRCLVGVPPGGCAASLVMSALVCIWPRVWLCAGSCIADVATVRAPRYWDCAGRGQVALSTQARMRLEIHAQQDMPLRRREEFLDATLFGAFETYVWQASACSVLQGPPAA
jgi:hypothetical protein